MGSETILVELRDAITLLRIDRPEALNRLKATICDKIKAAAKAYEVNPTQRCMAIAGNDGAFATGATIEEMESQGYAEINLADINWESLTRRESRSSRPWRALRSAVAGSWR